MCLFVHHAYLVQQGDGNLVQNGRNQGPYKKETDNKPGAAVSLYQLQSYLPVLIPKYSVKLKSARIWSAQVMTEKFSDSPYVNLIRSTSQE